MLNSGYRTLTFVVGLTLAANLSTASAAFGDTTGSARPTAADDGARVVSWTWLDQRMVDLEIKSPAVGATVPVRVLLPSGWSRHTTRTWPVLYLLQGAHDDYTSWTRETDIESFTADKDLIVVMPSSGPTGLPTRWWNSGKNTPDYETFQVTELMQLLQRDYRASPVRAVAGVSTGGYGAVMMAAHYPGAFTAAASYSGILDTAFSEMPAVLFAIVARESLNPETLWGDPEANASLWDADNPYAQATRLRFTALFISCGSGAGLDQDPGDLLGESLESALWSQSVAFAARLRLLGIPAQTDLYSGGVHDWSSWQGEFSRSWPLLAASLGLSS
jgi:diacylglycerol O-acyltransferase / trehalose O-mycolyltransferase